MLVDPLEISSQGKLGNSEHEVLLYEFKHDMNAYLESLGSGAPMRSLADLIAFNEKHADQELRYFGQETFLQAQEKGPLTEQTYLDAVERCRRFARKEGIDAVMDEHRLDAIVAPSGGPAGKTDLIYGDRDVGGSSSLAAVAGYPNITVPAGNVMGLPLGISFFGRAYSEPTLLKLAYAFEQATKARIAPNSCRRSVNSCRAGTARRIAIGQPFRWQSNRIMRGRHVETICFRGLDCNECCTTSCAGSGAKSRTRTRHTDIRTEFKEFGSTARADRKTAQGANESGQRFAHPAGKCAGHNSANQKLRRHIRSIRNGLPR